VLLDGDTLFIASNERSRDLMLPGLRVAVRRGHPPFADDLPWMAGLHKASIPRGLVENLARSRTRQGIARTLSDEELAAWVAQLAHAHDVASTFELIGDPVDARDIPGSGTEFMAQLERRHARLMAARPDKRPGQFKQEANRVGSYQFVAPELVRGTLDRGFALGDQLTLPFSRAVFMMFLISEVHPFDDGNGRLARLAMNAELTVAGQHRILVPLIVRNDYLAGLVLDGECSQVHSNLPAAG